VLFRSLEKNIAVKTVAIRDATSIVSELKETEASFKAQIEDPATSARNRKKAETGLAGKDDEIRVAKERLESLTTELSELNAQHEVLTNRVTSSMAKERSDREVRKSHKADHDRKVTEEMAVLRARRHAQLRGQAGGATGGAGAGDE